jgi:hypothetical protein
MSRLMSTWRLLRAGRGRDEAFACAIALFAEKSLRRAMDRYTDRETLLASISVILFALFSTQPVQTAHIPRDDRTRHAQISAWAPFFQAPDRADRNAYTKDTTTSRSAPPRYCVKLGFSQGSGESNTRKDARSHLSARRVDTDEVKRTETSTGIIY